MKDFEQIYNSIKDSVKISFDKEDYKKDEMGFVISDKNEVLYKGKPITTDEFLKQVFKAYKPNGNHIILGDTNHGFSDDVRTIEAALKHLPKGTIVDLEFSPEKIKYLMDGKDYSTMSLAEFSSPETKKIIMEKYQSIALVDTSEEKAKAAESFYNLLHTIKKQGLKANFYEDEATMNAFVEVMNSHAQSVQNDLKYLNKTFDQLAPEALNLILEQKYSSFNFARNMRDDKAIESLADGNARVIVCGAGHIFKSDDLDNKLFTATNKNSIKILTIVNDDDLKQYLDNSAGEIVHLLTKDGIKKYNPNENQLNHTPSVRPNFELPDYVMVENYKGEGPRVFKGEEFIKEKLKEMGVNFTDDNSKAGKKELIIPR